MKVVQIGAYKVTIGTDSRRRSLHGTQHNPTFIVNELCWDDGGLRRRRIKLFHLIIYIALSCALNLLFFSTLSFSFLSTFVLSFM